MASYWYKQLNRKVAEKSSLTVEFQLVNVAAKCETENHH